mmetsp:Transcript_35686/g.45040  ORF Transcript_35686/g.45040 Transcript_35686/m.45040 type:complete len:515 (-) Transcript_35686:8-1552(-)
MLQYSRLLFAVTAHACISGLAYAAFGHSNSSLDDVSTVFKIDCNGLACEKSGREQRSLWQYGGCFESSLTSDEYYLSITSPSDCSIISSQILNIQWETAHTTGEIFFYLTDHHHYYIGEVAANIADSSVTYDISSLEWGNQYYLNWWYQTGWYDYFSYSTFSLSECEITDQNCVSVSVSNGDSSHEDQCLYFSTGDIMIISWIAPPDASSVNIYLSYKWGWDDYENGDYGEDLIHLAFETCPLSQTYCTDSYDWNVGGTTISSRSAYRIKVVVTGTEDLGYSQTFTIDNRAGVDPQITVISPHESELYVEGDVMSIQWLVSGTDSWYSFAVSVDCERFEPFSTRQVDSIRITTVFPEVSFDGYYYIDWKVRSPTPLKLTECYIRLRFWCNGIEIFGMSDRFYLQANETCNPTQLPTVVATPMVDSIDESQDETLTPSTHDTDGNLQDNLGDTTITTAENLLDLDGNTTFSSDDDDQLMSKASSLHTKAFGHLCTSFILPFSLNGIFVMFKFLSF